MNDKQSFLEGLRRALTGKISSERVEEHIRYYEEYITAEMRMGRSEMDVLDSLGAPELIAMSICDADKAATEHKERYKGASNDANAYESVDSVEHERMQESEKDIPFLFRHPGLVIVTVVIIILAMLGVGIWLAVTLVSAFWPIIVVIFVVILLIRLIGFIRENW